MKSITRMRFSIAAMLMLLVAVVALPTTAYAASIASQLPAPGTTVHTAKTVSCDVLSGAKIKSATVNGAKAAVIQGTVAGTWSKTETLVSVGYYKTTWTWATGSGSGGVASVVAPFTPIVGSNTVTVVLTDLNGVASTGSWTFTYANPVPPIVVTPAGTSANAGCRSAGCHGTVYDNDNAMGPNCVSCHYNGFPKHGIDGAVAHVTVQGAIAANSVACVSCHGNVLTHVLPVDWDGANAPSEHKGCSCHVYNEAEGKTTCEGCHNGTHAPHVTGDAVTAHAAEVLKCEASGCHTGELPALHATEQCATCHTATVVKACIDCHATRIDSGGNVIAHYYTTAGHTATSMVLAGQRYPGTDAAAQAGNLSYLNPVYAWNFTCSDCHSMVNDIQHANPDSAGSCATCHNAGNTGAGDVLKGGEWNKSCLASGCHTADPNGGVPLAHLVNGQVDYAHSVAASLTALPGGCSATAGSGSYSGTAYGRATCHYSDIIQEHNRKIESGPNGTVVQTISVTCAQCHSSKSFKALNGTWDGTCDACHNGTTVETYTGSSYTMINHTIVGSTEYNRVHNLHQAPAYYSSGVNSTQFNLIAGMNSMDAHGPLRTAAVAAHPGAYKAIGCAQAFCHQNAYVKPGSGFYGATVCTQCHAANTATANSPSGLMSVNNGAVFSASTAVTVNSSIVANGGATLVSMAVDPGTGVYGTAVPYLPSYGITIPSSAGMKTIRVKYTDSAARVSTYTYWIWKVDGPSTITASVSGGNGTISPSGAVSVAQATDQTFTFAPSLGYRVDTLVVDSVPVSPPGSSYTFYGVAAPHTIVVTFAPATEAYIGAGPALNGDDGWQTGLTLAPGSALPANSALDFQTKFDIEDGWDYGYVQVSTNGGTSWTNIAGTFTTTADPNGALGGLGNAGNGITGTQGTLASAHFDLSAYAGQTVQIRFYYVCDWNTYGNSVTPATSGWHIDDVAVGPTGSPIFTDDFSTVKGEWTTYTNTSGYVWGY